MKKILPLLGFLFLLCSIGYTQQPQQNQINLPSFSPPQPTQFQRYDNFGSMKLPASSAPSQNFNYIDRNAQAERLRQETDRQIEAYYEQQNKAQKEIDEATNEMNRYTSVNYTFPFDPSQEGVQLFGKTYSYLNDMLAGKKPVNIKEAVFLTEHAYDPSLSYKDYCAQIEEMKNICLKKLVENGHSTNNNLAKIMAIYQFMCDTIRYKKSVVEGTLTTYPMQYDLEDNYGRIDIKKHFVTKLMKQHTGNCHSLPLLFLILCEELGTKAYLTYAPEHSFIKFQDNSKRRWFNMELTNHRFSTDAALLYSGYVKSEAVSNHIYLDTLSHKEVIASCLIDLSSNYERRYGGYDEFNYLVAETVLKYFPRNVRGLAVKSTYNDLLLRYVGNQLGSIERVKADPQAMKIWKQRDALYKYMDQIGYEEISPEAYAQFQRMMQSAKQKQVHEGQYIIIKQQLSK